MEEQYQYGPYFYQTLQHDFSSHSKIPQEVVRQFGIVPQKCRIKGSTKIYWDVSVEAIDQNMCFQEGWSVFANDHSLKEKDLLLFKYCGPSKFSVKIFCKNGVQKELNLEEEAEEFLPEPSYPC